MRLHDHVGFRSVLRQADAEGSGGGADTADGAGGGDGAAQPDTGQQRERRSESVLDLVGKGKSDGPGDKGAHDDATYRPDGLAANLIGEDDRATIDKLTKALKGFQRDASKQGVPDKPDGYVIKPSGDDDEIGNFLAENEQLVPVLDTARAAALKAGMPMAMFEAFIREYAQNGIDPQLLATPEERERIDAQQEHAALVKMYGTEARAEAVMDYVDGWGQELVKKGVISSDDIGAFREAFGAAEYTRIGYQIASYLRGQPAMPMHAKNVDGSGRPSLREAEAAMSAALSMKPGPDRDKAVTEAERGFVRVYKAEASSVGL